MFGPTERALSPLRRTRRRWKRPDLRSEEAHDMVWVRTRWRPRSRRMRWIRVQDGCAESPATAPSLTRKDAAQNGDKRAAALALRRRLLRRPGGRRGQRRHAGAGAAPSARALLCGRRRTDGANRPAASMDKVGAALLERPSAAPRRACRRQQSCCFGIEPTPGGRRARPAASTFDARGNDSEIAM